MKPPVRIEHTTTTKTPVSFKTYYAMRNRGYSESSTKGFIPFFITCLFALSFYFSTGLNASTAVLAWKLLSIAGMLVFMAIILYKPVVYIRGYKTFSHLEQNLSFKLTGWEKAAIHPALNNIYQWYKDCFINITFAENCTEQNREAILKACNSYCKEANDVIWIFSGDIYQWNVQGNTLKGSANVSVMGLLHRLLQQELEPLAKASGAIVSIEIRSSSKLLTLKVKESAFRND